MRRRQKPEVRREHILDCALKVFFEKGFERATMEEIAKAADLSKGGLYHYFSSTTEILLALFMRRSLTRMEELEDWSFSSPRGKDAMLRKFMDDNEERRLMSLFLWASISREELRPLLFQMMEEQKEVFIAQARAHGMEEALIEKTTSEEFLAFLMMVSLGMSHPWIRQVMTRCPRFIEVAIDDYLTEDDSKKGDDPR